MSKTWEDRWNRYALALKAAGVAGRYRAPCQGWVESFLKVLRPRKWWSAQPSDLRAYLAELAAKGRPTWQVEQAENALRLFFQEVEPIPWALDWSVATKAARPIPQPKGLVRDHAPVSTAWNETLLEMQADFQAANFSPRTTLAYASWIRRFLSFRQQEAAPANSEALAYLRYLEVDQKLSSSSVSQAAQALRFFFRIRYQQTLTAAPSARYQRPAPLILEPSQLSALLQCLPAGTNRLLGHLLASTGLTLLEAVSLRVGHVDLARRRISVDQGGPAARILALPEELAACFQDYLETLRASWQSDSDRGISSPAGENLWEDYFLFPAKSVRVATNGITRGPIHPQSFQQLLKRAAKRAALPERITPYTLRHTFAAQCSRAGWQAHELQEQLGQRNSAASRDLRGSGKP